jgi:hypothetical protein
MGKGGGSSQQQTSNSTQIPAWLESAAQGAVSTAQDLSQRPFTANPNPQVAPLTDQQNQAFQEIQNLQGGTQPAYAASEGALSGGGLLGMTAPITGASVGDTASQLMNPYTSAVVNPTVTAMRQGLQTNLQQIGANANAAGAYGGTRQGVEEGVARSQEAIGEGQLTGGLLSQGWNTALGQAGNIAGTNLQAGLTAANMLPSIATAGQGAAAQQAGLLQAAGTAQQQQQQAQYDAQNNAWYAQQNWPVQNLDLLLSAVGGVPYGTSSQGTTTVPQQSNTAGNIIGGISAAAGLLALV